MGVLLGAQGLHCERDDRVLFDGLSLEVSPGEVWQVQGANGSGKTTLLRILCGLNSSYEGQVCWQGKAVAEDRAAFAAGIFFLGHAPAIKRSLTARENLRWYCASQGQGSDADISAALDRFRLRGYEDFPVFQMSAGQQRRVSLARLCLSSAPLWILDEPFTALDRKGVQALEQFLVDHAASGGAVILTTHHELAMPCELRVLNLDHQAPEVADVS